MLAITRGNHRPLGKVRIDGDCSLCPTGGSSAINFACQPEGRVRDLLGQLIWTLGRFCSIRAEGGRALEQPRRLGARPRFRWCFGVGVCSPNNLKGPYRPADVRPAGIEVIRTPCAVFKQARVASGLRLLDQGIRGRSDKERTRTEAPALIGWRRL